MRARSLVAALLAMTLALVLGGCALLGGEEALEDEAALLLAADRAFAARAIEAGAPEAFRQYLDPEGMLLGASGEPLVGPERARAALASGPAQLLSWEPRYAEVFGAGDWGWTWGDWQAHEPGAGGRRVAQGRYVSVWKKQPDGSWKVRSGLNSAE